jgi:hypothetical protein
MSSGTGHIELVPPAPGVRDRRGVERAGSLATGEEVDVDAADAAAAELDVAGPPGRDGGPRVARSELGDDTRVVFGCT